MKDVQRNNFSKGLNTDHDATVVNGDSYVFSLNNRIITLHGDSPPDGQANIATLNLISGEGSSLSLRNIEGTESKELLPDGYYALGHRAIDNIAFIFSHKPADNALNIPASSEIGCYFLEGLAGRKIIKRVTPTAPPVAPDPPCCGTNPAETYYYLPSAELIDNSILTIDNRGVILDQDRENYITLFNDSCNEEKLNFELNHKLDVRAEINYDDSYNIYWTDNLNIPKKFNTITNYQLPITNPDSIDINCNTDFCDPLSFTPSVPKCLRFSVSLMDLVLPLVFPVIDSIYDELVLPGGELLAGGYRACVRYVTGDGNTTHWSYLSGLIEIVESSETTTNQNTYVGSGSDKLTNKKFRLKITNLDYRYSYIQMGVVHYTSDIAASGFLMKKVAVTDLEIGIDIKILECDGRFDGTFDVNELTIEKIYIDRTKSIEIVDNHLFHANITEVDIHNPCFLQIAKNIDVAFVIDDPIRKDEPLDKPIGINGRGGYKNPDNVFKRTGYWRKQKYGFYIQFVLNNGKKSLLYPVGDICDNTDLLYESFGYNTNVDGMQVANESIIGRDYAGPVNDIVINYTRARFTNIDLTSVQNEIQGYAIFRSDRQGEVAIAEGLVTVTPSYNPHDINDKCSEDGENRFTPTSSAATWRILKMPQCNALALDHRELFMNNWVFKPPTDADTTDCNWNNPIPDYVKPDVDDELKTLALFTPEAHISLKTLQTVKGSRIEFRYDIDKSENFTGILDMATNNCLDIINDNDCAGCPNIYFSAHIIKRYYHRFNDWRTKEVVSSFMSLVVDESKYIDYDDLNTYLIYGAAYKNIFPAALSHSANPTTNCLLTKERDEPDCDPDENYRKSWYFRAGSNIIIHPEAWVASSGSLYTLIDPQGTGISGNDLPESIAAYLVNKGIRAPEDRNVFFTNLYRPIDLNNLIDDTYVTGGDCYIVEAFMPIAVQTQTGNIGADDTNLGVYAGFHIESESNLDLRYRPIAPQQSTLGDNTMIPLDYLSWNAFTGKDREDSRLYNKAHHALNKQNTGAVFTKDLIDPINFNLKENTKHLYSRILYSPKKILGQRVDTYRDYLPNDFIDEQFNYGEINSIIAMKDNLFVVMDKALLLEPISVPTVIASNAGSLNLTSGTVFQPRTNIITIDYGSIHKWSVVRTNTGIYGYDYYNKAIWRYSDKLDIISKSRNVGRIVEEISNEKMGNLPDTLMVEKHDLLDIRQVVFHFDEKYQELLCTFVHKSFLGSDVRSQTLVFSEMLDRFTGNYFSERGGFIDDQAMIRDINPYYYFSINTNTYALIKEQSNNINLLNVQNRNGTLFDILNVPSKIIYIVNKKPDAVKVFDNAIVYLNGYIDNRFDNTLFFDTIKVVTEYQDTGIVPLVLGDNLQVRSRKKYIDIPRNILDVVTVNGKIYRERMRDRYCYIYLTFIPSDDERIDLNFIDTVYRQDFR